MEGFVSKLSAKLQQAAFSNSSEFTVKTFVVENKYFWVAFLLLLNVTPSNTLSN
jgi:hypothetical protein